jgi:hypothetical protein
MQYTYFSAATPRRRPRVGDRIHWEGDVANAPRSGEVVAVGAGQMDVRWDEAENVGWEDGEAVAYVQPASRLPASILTSARWHFEDEYLAVREAGIAEAVARYAAVSAARRGA